MKKLFSLLFDRFTIALGLVWLSVIVGLGLIQRFS